MELRKRIFSGLVIGGLMGFLSAPIYHGLKGDYDENKQQDRRPYNYHELGYVGSAAVIGGLVGAGTVFLGKRKQMH
jgi:hypothetical protein